MDERQSSSSQVSTYHAFVMPRRTKRAPSAPVPAADQVYFEHISHYESRVPRAHPREVEDLDGVVNESFRRGDDLVFGGVPRNGVVNEVIYRLTPQRWAELEAEDPSWKRGNEKRLFVRLGDGQTDKSTRQALTGPPDVTYVALSYFWLSAAYPLRLPAS